MEVHQHSHLVAKKWTHYIWEFLMLFLAVFAGFLAENLRENRVEHNRAREYAQMLKADLVSDTIQLQEFARVKDSTIKEYDSLKKFYETPSEEIRVSHWDSADGHGINHTPFTPNDATLSLLKNSGNLRYFKDTSLLIRIVKYDVILKGLKDFLAIINSLYPIGSERVLKARILEKKFRNKHLKLSPKSLLKSAGYNFDSWDENAAINVGLMNNMGSAYTDYYPEINKMATELIILLNKDYKLK